MKFYNFNRLIDKYSVNFTFVSRGDGEYVGGQWVKGNEIKKTCKGAIVPLSDQKIYQSGGTYTSRDRQLYTKTKLFDALNESKVVYKNNLYSIESEVDYDDYADVYVYTLKWVSVFDKS